jgi:hypothetical protein
MEIGCRYIAGNEKEVIAGGGNNERHQPRGKIIAMGSYYEIQISKILSSA